MREDLARTIIAWRYEEPYALYDMSADDLDEVMAGSYYAAMSAPGDLAGFFCVGPSAQVPGGHTAALYTGEDALDLGLGLRPDLTGQGLGCDFLRAGCDFARQQFAPALLRLSVIAANTRAVHLYEAAGFETGVRFMSTTPAGETQFRLMTRPT